MNHFPGLGGKRKGGLAILLGLAIFLPTPAWAQNRAPLFPSMGAMEGNKAQPVARGNGVPAVDTGLSLEDIFPEASEVVAAGLNMVDEAVARGAGSCCCTATVPARLSLRHDFGDGVGYERGFSTIEGFVPVWQSGADALVFADLRAVNFDDAERWEINAGGGVRTFSCLLDRVLGFNAFYDGRKTNANYFNQAGIGFEALGKILEVRVNGYFIFDGERKLASDTGVVNLGTVGGNTVFGRTQIFEVARSGVEAEVGAPVPFLERIYTRAYVGFYSYGAHGVETANGVRGRIEAQLTRRVSLHFSVQNDQVFDTTVTGGLSISFGAPAFRAGSGEPTWIDILGQRVNRDVNIVISEDTATATTAVPLPRIID